MDAKQVIKKTLQTLPSKTSRRTYLKTLGIKFNDSKYLFESISGGAGDIDLEDFICPITQCIFIQPVVAADGFTYEKTSLDYVGMYPIRTASGVMLESRHYIPNMIVRNAIRHLVSQMATNPKVKKFFEENWNFDLARELGIPKFTVPAVVKSLAETIVSEQAMPPSAEYFSELAATRARRRREGNAPTSEQTSASRIVTRTLRRSLATRARLRRVAANVARFIETGGTMTAIQTPRGPAIRLGVDGEVVLFTELQQLHRGRADYRGDPGSLYPERERRARRFFWLGDLTPTRTWTRTIHGDRDSATLSPPSHVSTPPTTSSESRRSRRSRRRFDNPDTWSFNDRASNFREVS